MQGSVRKEIISHAEENLVLTGIDRKELGVVALLVEILKNRTKRWWLQKDVNTIENMILYEIEMEDGTTRNPTAREEMEHCHVSNRRPLFKSLIQVMRS